MIVSKNRNAEESEFQKLVELATNSLNEKAKENPDYFKKRSGIKLEKDVEEILNKLAMGTSFEGTIKRISGQKFPDIVAKKYYGVEVKTTKSDSWVSTGSSIMESTRVENVKRIYMLFGKLAKPIEFKYKCYEDCLSDIVVTHSPRYRIDMELEKGETIFEKMDISYDKFRNSSSPIDKVKNYYRSILKPGQNLWWVDSEPIEDQSVSPIIRMWNTLEVKEKKELQVKGYCWFPEIFSSKNDKFNRLAIWLVTHQAVLTTSLRDIYTAGGRMNIDTNDITWENQPQIYYKMYSLRSEITNELLTASKEWVEEFWGVTPLKGVSRIEQWIDLVIDNIDGDKTKTKEMLYDIFGL